MSLITVLYQYLRSRKRKIPLSAQNDVKAKRLWQCDPQAYQRKFGDIDRQLQANLEKNPKDEGT
ncbi:hypothetical protein [Motiliproteus sp. MSK22-1]|uniref:hypothetical protein n=1 Tax=Motiliproteus sp. MSK22-1 TaxID=1897630 RepID=UPI001180E1CB|nr:hypothetical protein [Motiliproteus sp. MSK22-1]